MVKSIILFCLTFIVGVQLRDLPDDRVHFRDAHKYEFESCVTSILEPGICTRSYNCPESNFIKQIEDICSFDPFDNKLPIVCCTSPYNDEEQVVIRASPFSHNPEKNIIQEYCDFLYPNEPTEEIKLKPGEFSYMAAFGWLLPDGLIDWKCHGSLINENFILTSAHCFVDTVPNFVRVGDLDLNSTDTWDVGQNFNIVQITKHPEYDGSTLYNDIALVEIQPRVRITLQIRPICLWPFEDVVETNFVSSNYGTGRRYLDMDPYLPYQAMQNAFNYIQQDDCKKYNPPSGFIPNGIADSQLCAQSSDKHPASCQDDFGGPLLLQKVLNYAERLYLVGVSSFGKTCNTGQPAIFTRIGPYLKWIESIAWSRL